MDSFKNGKYPLKMLDMLQIKHSKTKIPFQFTSIDSSSILILLIYFLILGNEMLIPNSLSLPTPPTHNPFFSMTRQPSPLFGSLGLSKTGFCPPSSINPMPNPPPFRYQQQPPPMKSCLSCHQQIHRYKQ